MITNISIKNIGIIDNLSINFNKGLNVLTGETGAGKTLIIDSLGILAGGRFSKEMIRYGEESSYVEMGMYLPNRGYEEDTIIVSREINLSGRNLCKINGRLVTVTELKNFMKNIIDIHNQGENQSLLEKNNYIEILDEFAKEELKDIKRKYQDYYVKYLEIKEELKNNYGDDKEKQRELNLLNYEVKEIEKANLEVGEEENLELKKKLISNSEKIINSLNNAENSLNEGTIEGLNIAIKTLEKIEGIDKKYEDIVNKLKNNYYEIQEITREISYSKGNIDFSSEEQNEIEERLDLIKDFKRKYGNTIQEIIEYKLSAEEKIRKIENLDEYICKLKRDFDENEKELIRASKKIEEIRKKHSKILEGRINYELEELEMKKAKFYIKIEESEEYTLTGKNKIDFLIKTNAGDEAKPLHKIASGGETSRIMLAIKNVLANIDKVPVIVFDEIDTGISGNAAIKTGKKIKNVSKNHQVICITHLATLAAMADYNYYVYKNVEDEKTITKVKELDEKETIEEIAKISSGKITNVSLNYAKELRHGNRKIA